MALLIFGVSIPQTKYMVTSFGDKRTKKIWDGERVKELSIALQETARRKLRMLNSSQDLNDLMVPPSNRLEKLKGNLKDLFHTY